jgi:hypothetical protein
MMLVLTESRTPPDAQNQAESISCATSGKNIADTNALDAAIRALLSIK